MRHSLMILLVVLPIAAKAQGSAPGTPEPSVLVTTETPRQGTLPRTLTAYGTVQAAPGGSQALSLLRGGQVILVRVAVGQRVHRGEALLTVSADQAALSTYRQAVTALSVAQGERGRLTQMLAQHLATRDQLALADKAVTDAQANLDTLAKAGGGSAEQTLSAPFDGVVSNLSVASGARIPPQAPLVTLDRSSRLVASVGVEPSQRGLLAPGQAAQVESLDGGSPLPGSVLSVGAMLDPVSRLVPVRVDPPGNDPLAGLLPGGAVRVVVQVGEYRGWLTPRAAVLTDANGAYVFQVDGGKAARVDVHVAGVVGTTTVVTGAIDPGRPLVTSGNYQLQGGETVREEAARP